MDSTELLELDEFVELFNVKIKESNEVKSIEDSIINVINKPVKQTGINSGIKKLDKFSDGWKNGELIFIGVSPEYNKSGLAKTLLLNPVVNDEKSIGYFSNNSNINNELGAMCLSYSGLFNSTFENGIEVLTKAPIHLNCNAKISINELTHSIYLLKEKYDVDQIIIEDFDYIFHTDKELSKTQSERVILKALKKSVYLFNIPIIVLNHTPIDREVLDLGRLKISNEVENLADLILLLRKTQDMYGVSKIELNFSKYIDNELKNVAVKYNRGFNFFTDEDS